MHLFGDKETIAINVNLNKVIPDKRIILCGLELWLAGNSFGDIDDIDILGGNNYNMILQLQEKHIPTSSTFLFRDNTQIYNSIYENFIGENLDTNAYTLNEIAEHGRYWKKFVISPNGTAQFDQYFIFYYKEENNVCFLYQLEKDTKVQTVKLPMSLVNSVSTECIKYFDLLLSNASSAEQ